MAAARMRILSALALTVAPSGKSMTRLTLPSKLELKSWAGSASEAPLAKLHRLLVGLTGTDDSVAEPDGRVPLPLLFDSGV